MVDSPSGFEVEVLSVELAGLEICPLVSGKRTGH